jgi:nucleotide-binding universal stress UspA family protein
MKSETIVPNPTAEYEKISVRKILVPIDFSPASKTALWYALRIAETRNSEITLLHVLEPQDPAALAGRPAAAAFSEQELADAEEALRCLADSAKATSGVGTILRTGVPTHEIIEAAKELDVDLIVISTHGFTGWKRFHLGSTAERVARAATCPVLVVRLKEHDAPEAKT